MASENETIAEIVKDLRGIKGGQHTNGGLSFERWRARCQFADDYADRIEAAHRREDETARIAACSAQARFDEEIEDKLRVIRELNEVRELNRRCCDENERLRECLKGRSEYCVQFRLKGTDEKWDVINWSVGTHKRAKYSLKCMLGDRTYSRYEYRVATRRITEWEA